MDYMWCKQWGQIDNSDKADNSAIKLTEYSPLNPKHRHNVPPVLRKVPTLHLTVFPFTMSG